MNRKSSSGLPAADGQVPGPETHKRHFDTFETQFFKDGDAVSAAAEVDHFEDLDDGKRRRFAPSRQFVIGVVAGSACLAVIGCVALWRSGGKSTQAAAIAEKMPEPAPVASPPPAAAAAADPTPAPGATQAQAAVVAPTPAASPAPAVAAEPVPAAAAPAVAVAPVPAAAPAVAPAPAAAGSAPAAAVPPAPAPSGKPASPEPAVAATPSPSPAAAQVAAAETTPPPAGAAIKATVASGDAATARARCKEIAAGRRQKDLLSVCSEAFAADPSAADVAVILAKAEFDKGHAAEAMAWSQKALAADPNAADAYVFIGGVEQSAGHKKAAKEAYRRYLQLAPAGRYAGDLRAIVGTL